MSLLTINKLTATVGAEVAGIDSDRLASDDSLGAAVLDALEDNGVLVFRGLHLEPEAQVAFCRRLGEIDRSVRRPTPGVGHLPDHAGQVEERLGGLPEGDLRLAHRRLHADSTTNDPQKATVLSAVQVAETRRRNRIRQLLCRLRGVQRRREGALRRRCGSCTRWRPRSAASPPTRRRNCWRGGGPGPPTSTRWCGRIAVAESHWCSAHPPTTSSAWTSTRAGHCSPNCSTAPPRRTRSTATRWSVGDTVIWDNRGVLHRAAPYEPNSPREMLRTTVLGDEPIQ